MELTDATGFPMMVNAFEGNRAQTTTMLPVIPLAGRGQEQGGHRHVLGGVIPAQVVGEVEIGRTRGIRGLEGHAGDVLVREGAEHPDPALGVARQPDAGQVDAPVQWVIGPA